MAEDLAAHLLSETQNPRSPLAPAPVSAAPPWASPELRASALQRVDRSSLLLTSLNFSYLLSPNTATLEAKLQTGTWQGRKLSSVQQPVPQHLWVVPSGPGGGTWWGSRTGHTLLSEGQLAIPSEPNAQSTAARTLPEISREGKQEQHGMGGAMQGAQACLQSLTKGVPEPRFQPGQSVHYSPAALPFFSPPVLTQALKQKEHSV